jgi:predicted Zn-dependent peptidase
VKPAFWLVTKGTIAGRAIEIPHESYRLDNGLHVVLHHDSTLPQVVVNMWYDVGARNEVKGRSGFAHLFEHLMFMGTARMPGSAFDDVMEAHGGWNNAWTGADATDYYAVGPTGLLDVLVWLEADRMSGLASAMTKEKLDLQRDVVRNERRQTHEDAPYGEVWLVLPEVMFPPGHPYAHPIIGSHEDLEAATLEDVLAFFGDHYVPANASLAIAGDFDPTHARAVVERTFGSIPRGTPRARVHADPVDRPRTSLVELTDKVQIPETNLFWHTPAAYMDGDAESDFVAAILGEGRSSRLYERLIRTGEALEVEAFQHSQQLGSIFGVTAMPAEGRRVEDIEAVVQAEIAALAAGGPTPEELERIRNQLESEFLRGLESLFSRATTLNRYWAATGDSGFISEDLRRYRSVTAEGVQKAAARLTPDRRAIIRVRPERAA